MSNESYVPCGGCGATHPNERCINCFHDFTPNNQAEGAVERKEEVTICKKCDGNGMVNEPNKPEKHECEFCDGFGVMEGELLRELLAWYQGKGDQYRNDTLLVDCVKDFLNQLTKR